ncbi:MAG TPA: chemotaxis protein CheA [Bacteroidales bacterium]|nr:chemotaxis protein CheA [Bacteroidales bacterium]
MDKFKQKFLEEATDHINDLEEALLLLENAPEDQQLVERVFRAMHSLKGGGAMFGFERLSEFTHDLETLYDLVREHQLNVTHDLLDITLASVDHLKVLLEDDELELVENQTRHHNLLLQIKKIIKQEPVDKKNKTEVQQDATDEHKTYYIYFEPNSDIFNDGTNPLFLLDELYSIGDCKVFAHLNKVPRFSDLDQTRCYTYWEVILATDEGLNAVNDVFIFVEDQSKLEVLEVHDGNLFKYPKLIKEIEELATTREDVGINTLEELIHKQELSDSQHTEQNIEQDMPVRRKMQAKDTTISSIRVSSSKLDSMMNLVSELVTTQARLSLYAEQSDDPELATIAENVQKLSRQLRDNAFDIVLVPIETMLTRFQRMVRDLSSELGKQVDFMAEGLDTELDKTIIETLTDPIMHILRNSIDHGIETIEERKKKGKRENGKILMKAFYSGANVHIQIHDDGAGIDPEKIRAKAIAKGIIRQDMQLSQKEIFDLLFLPGFSTAQNVTDVSGRGVGMDVVKRKLAEIRGEIDVDSEIGMGTTLTIKLPLTLSIIDGLLVKMAHNYYVVPLSAVDKIYAAEHDKVKDIFNSLIVLDGEQIPFYYLREEFSMSDSEQETEQIVVVHYEEKRIGIVVDEVVGEYQAVLKSLGKMYKGQEIISGATILGDGTVALVLDTNKMINIFSGDDRHINQEKLSKKQ